MIGGLEGTNPFVWVLGSVDTELILVDRAAVVLLLELDSQTDVSVFTVESFDLGRTTTVFATETTFFCWHKTVDSGTVNVSLADDVCVVTDDGACTRAADEVVGFSRIVGVFTIHFPITSKQIYYK